MNARLKLLLGKLEALAARWDAQRQEVIIDLASLKPAEAALGRDPKLRLDRGKKQLLVSPGSCAAGFSSQTLLACIKVLSAPQKLPG